MTIDTFAKRNLLRKTTVTLSMFAALSMFPATQALAEKESEKIGDWTFEHTYDSLERTHSYSAQYTEDDKRGISFSCIEKGEDPVVLFVAAEVYFGKGDTTEVQYRVNDNKLHTAQWRLFGHSLVRTDSAYVDAFAEKLKAANSGKLVIEGEDYKHTEHRAIVSLNGARKAISKLYEKCKE